MQGHVSAQQCDVLMQCSLKKLLCSRKRASCAFWGISKGWNEEEPNLSVRTHMQVFCPSVVWINTWFCNGAFHILNSFQQRYTINLIIYLLFLYFKKMFWSSLTLCIWPKKGYTHLSLSISHIILKRDNQKKKDISLI